ncbi:ABC transporter permease subunit [Anderseniella sp. Alg231-50]|uniref:ABC transporter permease subunit n=1 Tax=Anderseniella sp. Alg231-50 TaxID=1922226 RepID=UPI000D54FB3A
MSLDFSIFVNYGPQLVLGFWMTIKIVVCAIILGMPFGLILALGRRSRFLVFRAVCACFIEVFRNTPFIIQVFLFFYVLPFYGVRLAAEYVGVLALAAFGSAYFAEVIRGGIEAVAKGQLESARATGMTDWQAMRHIILPQTLPIILPPLTNQTLSLVKESAILSTITVRELTMAGITVQAETFRPFEAFIMIALLYWGLNETIATLMRRIERKASRRPGSDPTATATRSAPAVNRG